MKKELKGKLKRIISYCEAVRCVYIKNNDFFFLFRKISRYDGVDVNYEDDGYGRPVAVVYGDRQGDFDDCAILHNNKLIQRQKKIKTYIFQYKQNIEQSPEFFISDILEKKTFKVFSQEYLTPIKELFREIISLKDGRAGRHPVDKIVIIRNNFFVNYYVKLGSPNRIPMQEIQEKWSEKLTKLLPTDPNAVAKYCVSDDTVRRIIKCRIKK